MYSSIIYCIQCLPVVELRNSVVKLILLYRHKNTSLLIFLASVHSVFFILDITETLLSNCLAGYMC